MSDEGVGDRAPLDALAQAAGPELARQMIDIFLQVTPGRVESVRKAAHAGDREALRAAAHMMKSGAGQLGVTGMSRSCAELEEEARTAGPERLAELVARMVAATEVGSAWLVSVRGDFA